MYSKSKSSVELVPCKYCGTLTYSTGTKLCDPCWEISNRLAKFLRSGPKAVEFVRSELEDVTGVRIKL